MANDKVVYLDNAATTEPYPEVSERIKEILDFTYGNSSSAHSKGLEAHRVVKKSTETLANMLNCNPEEIVITSGASEANNMAIKGYAFANMKAGKTIITSAYEHPTVLATVRNMERFGLKNYICGIDNMGYVKDRNIKDNVNEDTLMVSIMTINSETGTFNDIGKISTDVKAINEKVAVHTDSVQAFCKYKLDMQKWNNLDMLSVSSHKIKGPKGMGMLFIRKGTNIIPLIDGGGQQMGRRSGTENTAGIAGFALATEMYSKESTNYFTHVTELNSYLRNKLATAISDYIINSPNDASPYVLNVALKDIRSEIVLNHMSGKGIFIAAGSACSSKNKGNSHVLEAMRVPGDYIRGALRVSFGPTNTKEDIDIFIYELSSVLPRFRSLRKR
ncbi:MAG: cysteine desulfurase [Clostridiales bacterium]|nr:cysteine desulfurase [Clostridiales bacterium]